tara:strand:+ start:57 stop:185 length:129 start_codon:yes stop_codon:yes gene_type:complete
MMMFWHMLILPEQNQLLIPKNGEKKFRQNFDPFTFFASLAIW